MKIVQGNIANKSIFEWSYLAILGLLGFGLTGIYVTMNILHFPFFFIEWLYIPIILVYGKKAVRIVKKVDIYHVFIALLLFTGLAYNLIYHGAFSTITDYRSIVYLIIVYRVIKREGMGGRLHDFLIVCLFASISELIYIAFLSSSSVVSSTNCLASAIAIIGFFVVDEYLLGVLAFFIAMLTGILSGYRIGILFSMFSIIIACIYILFQRRGKRFWKKKIGDVAFVVVGVMLLMLFIRNYEPIITFIAEKTHMNSFAVFRITTRMEAIYKMDFSQSQDDGRLDLWMLPFTDFFNSIIPKGFTRKAGYIIDVPILALYDTLGSITSWIIVLFFCVQFVKTIISILDYKNNMVLEERMLKEMSICLFPVLVGLFISNGTFLSNLYQSIETGIILGWIAHVPKKYKKSSCGS